MGTNTSDSYAIPPNMFGNIPEEFFGALGRVVMVTALLELRLLDLVTALDHTMQEEHAGEPGRELIRACRTLLPDQDPSLSAEALDMLDRVHDALGMRNAVVHSLWPSPSTAAAFGWRPVTKSKRAAAGQPFVDINVSLTELQNLVRRMVGLIAEVMMITQRVGHS